MNGLLKSCKAYFKGKNKATVFLIVGIAGILLIGLSQYRSSSSNQAEQPVSSAIIDAEYATGLEEKISSLVTAITGDKSCLVAVTLENGSEYIYADQNTIDSDQTQDTAGSDVTTKESKKSEQEYIIVKGEGGTEQALIVTEKKPSIRGVAIVAAGVNASNNEQIMQSVTAMLGITSRKISIVCGEPNP